MSSVVFFTLFGALPIAVALLQYVLADDLNEIADKADAAGGACDGVCS